MDHAEAEDLIEAAAVEPGGLDRLAAGDTPESAALAGHLAGCPDCADELVRMGRDADLLRRTIRLLPPPDLRHRTLEYVRTMGRRSAHPQAPAAPVPATLATGLAGGRLPTWLAGTAAVALVAVVGTAAVLLGAQSAERERLDSTVAALARINRATIALASNAGTREVTLTSADGSTSGRLLFDPDTTELVVVAEGMTEPPEGREYRCWVDVAGRREPVGRMFFGGGLSYWAGPVPALAGIGPGTRFGVTLVDAAGASLDGEPVLGGAL